MNNNPGKTHSAQEYLSAALTGHGLITKIGHADDVKAGYMRLIALAEKRKRGVRFLPAQVIKRALRKHKTAGL
ncbi:hypothetical protein [Pseudomonas aeruginosa]|uniref:hypothetical protein n=1 Tax=Pseudomonas aeruginosa TaxID=287 RepID=UPI00093D312F|nr:hypothetical protein [Pseudomonas aeruginosa]